MKIYEAGLAIDYEGEYDQAFFVYEANAIAYIQNLIEQVGGEYEPPVRSRWGTLEWNHRHGNYYVCERRLEDTE